MGDMAPYQAFAIGGLGSVRGYGEGAVGSGRLCLVGNCEYTVPLVCTTVLPPFQNIRWFSFFLIWMYLDAFSCVDSLISIRM